MGGASAYIDHADAIGSTTMETDPSGAVVWDIAYYPWGQVLAQGGTRQSQVFAGMDWQVNDPLIPSATREYSDGLGRWMTPDPEGGYLENPQTLNKYVYAGNNPTSLADPSGQDFYLTCTPGNKNGDTCRQIDNGGQSVWVQGTMGKQGFTPTQIANEGGKLVDTQTGKGAYKGTFDEHGVHFTAANGTISNAIFAHNTSETDLQGSGLFSGFTGRFNDNCGGTCTASGGIEGSPGAFAVLTDVLSHSGLEDITDLFHWGAKNYRYPTASGPSPHIVDRGGTRARGFDAFHFDTSYPYATVPGFFDHAGSVSRSIGHFFTGPHPLPAPEDLP